MPILALLSNLRMAFGGLAVIGLLGTFIYIKHLQTTISTVQDENRIYRESLMTAAQVNTDNLVAMQTLKNDYDVEISILQAAQETEKDRKVNVTTIRDKTFQVADGDVAIALSDVLDSLRLAAASNDGKDKGSETRGTIISVKLPVRPPSSNSHQAIRSR